MGLHSRNPEISKMRSDPTALLKSGDPASCLAHDTRNESLVTHLQEQQFMLWKYAPSVSARAAIMAISSADSQYPL